MGVLLHAHYRLMGPNGQKVVMPAPVDKDTPNAPWWWDHLAAQAADLRRAGFSAVLLPPLCKTASGAAPDADGYGLFDNYDIGSRNQFFNIPTRFGDYERLPRTIAVMHACGLDVYADLVMHQYIGGNNFTYTYLGADGKTRNGRFPKHPSCFVGPPPRVPVDPVANPQGNFAFGDMASYINSTPKDYMLDGAIEAADWLTRTLDVQGYRIDDVKGMAVHAVRRVLDSKSMAGRFAVGEYFDGNPSALHWWVRNSGTGGRSTVFDFTLHWAIQAMCDNSSRWWMGGLQGAGYMAIDPLSAVTFVDNPDTDLSFGENVIWNKMLGYALIYTPPGSNGLGSLTAVDWWTPWTDNGRTGGNPEGETERPRPNNFRKDVHLARTVGLNAMNMAGAWRDQDFGAGGPVLVPSIDALLSSGKDGVLYTADRHNLGKTNPTDLDPAATGRNYGKLKTAPIFYTYYPGPQPSAAPKNATDLNFWSGNRTHHLHGTPVPWNSNAHGWMHFCWGENGNLRAWTIAASGASKYMTCSAEVASAQATVSLGGMPGGMISLSANGGADGIIWASIPYTDANTDKNCPGRFVAYDAANFGTFSDGSGSIQPLWDSQQWNWQFTHNKFNRPVVWNGGVFLPTYSAEVLVLGLA